MNNYQSSMYFEDYILGQEFKTLSRTITETDIVNFAGISGDFNQIHTDTTYASRSPYNKRVAHGLLGLSIASGLSARLGFGEGTTLAFRRIEWKFIGPILIGDTIRVNLLVLDKRKIKRSDGGIVIFKVSVINQEDEEVQSGKWSMIFKLREDGND